LLGVLPDHPDFTAQDLFVDSEFFNYVLTTSPDEIKTIENYIINTMANSNP